MEMLLLTNCSQYWELILLHTGKEEKLTHSLLLYINIGFKQVDRLLSVVQDIVVLEAVTKEALSRN